MKMILDTIPHSEQRYETCGDWYESLDDAGAPILRVRASTLGDWRMEALVIVHELVEALLCQHVGITDETVTAFDKAFEAQRSADSIAEPGDDPGAPYQRQHCIATAVERLLAAELGVDWSAYEETVNKL